MPPKSAVKHRIHFADGNKGGVGKSMLARTLYQCFLDRNKPVKGVDADTGDTPDFSGVYGEEVINSQFSEDEDSNSYANAILNLAIEGADVVVNMPARAHKAFHLWLNTYGVLELADANQIELIKWFVCTGEFDSVKSLSNSLREFGSQIPHVVVKNQKYKEWEFFNADEEVQGLIQQHRCLVIDLPRLPTRIASELLRQRLTFAQAKSYKQTWFGTAEQWAVQTYLKAAYKAFESTGYLPQ